jgi:folate-binding protein YgfZ
MPMPQRPSYLALDDRAILEVAGADRVAFLQGLVSNDVTKAGPERVLYAALLTAQGRFLHDFFIAAAGETLLIDGEAARIDDLNRRLSLFRLRSKVTLRIARDQWLVAAAFGGDSASALGLAAEPGAAKLFDEGLAYVDPRLAALGVRLVLPRAHGTDALAAAGFALAPCEDYDRLRLSLGVPDGSRDLPAEKALLVESGFDELNGIDWQKGCYIGQELTARMKYRALVKKRLMPVAVEGPLPPPGTPVMQGAEEAGEMRTGRDDRALALLRLDAVESAASGGAALTAGEARLTPVRPRWLTLTP